MAVLAIEPNLSAAEVAERTAMDKVAVSRAVTSLVAMQRLERQIAPKDRRKSMLRLSTEGSRIYAEIVPIALRYEKALMDVLDSADREALERIINTLLARARTLGENA